MNFLENFFQFIKINKILLNKSKGKLKIIK